MRPEEMVGQMLSHYRILRSLGYGGTATVFLAQDIHLQRNVAIKVFLSREDDTQDFLRRFAREARVLAQLDHPNILPVYEYGEEGSLAFLVMPHMAGGSLRDWLRKRGAVSPTETIQLLSQILSALQYAHERNLIHRDIKPGNMLFKADGTLMLSDFGLVKVLAAEDGNVSLLNDSVSSTTQELTGTPDYMAPEQIQGKVVPASDIYAVGVVLYEMLTGKHLFDADNSIGVLVKHMHEQPRPLREINPRISPELESVVMRALHKDPARRYQHPADLRQALLQALRKDAISITNRGTEPTPAISPASLPSMPIIENISLNKQPSPMHLNTPQSTPVTPTSTTQSNAHPAARMSSSEPAIPGPTSYVPPLSYMPQPSPPTAQRPRSGRPLVVVLILIILALAASLSGVLYIQSHRLTTIIPPGKHPTTGITSMKKGGLTPVVGSTQPVPPTQTDCPASGKARAEIIAPLVLGNNPNVVYIVNEGTPDNPTYGTIKRHEANFQTIAGIEIKKMAQTYIIEAQVSQNGQWVLFVAQTNGQSELRMVRVDGQGLQTLYCAPTNQAISHSQWSFNQRMVVFNAGSDAGIPTTYLLDVTTGDVQAEFIPQSPLTYTPRTWLDKTRIYMTSSNTGTQNLYVLNTSNGANQHDKDLQKIVPGLQPCGSFDSSYDSTQLLISACQLTLSAQSGGMLLHTGPTTITSEPAIGGTPHTITMLPHAVTVLRAISQTILLLLVKNSSGDISQNGLWEMNTDGTGLTRLTTDKNGDQFLCQFSQYSWSNVSRDGSIYAFQEVISNAKANTSTYNLYYGLMSGGMPYQFAGITGTQLLLAGWTSL